MMQAKPAGSLAYIYPLYEAAERGEMAAQYLLAHAYLTGSGVTANYKTAILWLCKSASQEYLPAIIRCGDIYSNGDYGIPQTPENKLEGYKWWYKAAELGAYNCAVRIGLNYTLGYPEKDMVKAWAWFDQATSFDVAPAIDGKLHVESQMTKEELAQAINLSDELRSKIAANIEAYNLLHSEYSRTGKLDIVSN